MLLSNTYGNSHSVRYILCIIMSLLILIVIERLFAGRFATQRENHFSNRGSDINKENVHMKLFYYK
jgi:C4-dicarboxylate transporter